MKKQVKYKSEVRPSILFHIGKVIFLSFGKKTVYDEPALYETRYFNELKKYKNAIKNRKAYFKYGKKTVGKIIKTDITTHRNLLDVTIFEYYAIIEFSDDNGNIITFKTEELNVNSEYLSNKQVTVYYMDNSYYATDFGIAYIED